MRNVADRRARQRGAVLTRAAFSLVRDRVAKECSPAGGLSIMTRYQAVRSDAG